MYTKLTIHSHFFSLKNKLYSYLEKVWGLQRHNFQTFQLCWTKWLSEKFWLDAFWELMGVGVGLVALQSLLTYKKDTSLFNFQSNGPFSKFLQQQMAISKFLSDVFWENTRCEGVSTPHHSRLKKDTRISDY